MRKAESRKRVVKYVVPAMLTNASFFLFTVIDGIFVGQGVGSDALGAVSVAFPFVMALVAISTWFTTGGITIVAICFGRGEKENANKAFIHSLTMVAIVSVIFTLLGIGLPEQMGRLFGASDVYIGMVKEYIFYYSIFTIPCALEINLMGFCRNDGSPMLVGVTTAFTSAINIFLDWLFVFPLGMGLKGAALATGISETVGLLIVISRYIARKGNLRIRREKLDKKVIREICYRGLPEMVAQFASPILVACYNWVLITKIGELGVNAYAIIDYVASFTVSIFMGVSEGYQPLFGNAFGAEDKESLYYYLRSAFVVALVGSSLCIGIILAFNAPICALFGADDITLEYTVTKMAPYAWGFIVCSLNVVISAFLYSTNHSGKALLLNILRSMVVNVLVIFLFPQIFGAEIIWSTYGIYESIMLVFSGIVLWKVTKCK